MWHIRRKPFSVKPGLLALMTGASLVALANPALAAVEFKFVPPKGVDVVKIQ